jgi:hypothetical protein
MPAVADFRLLNIEQKGDGLVIEGHSPNESVVTQFGRSLEFSSGLFSNVSIETERKELQTKKVDLKPGEVIDENAPKPETVQFKISCKYSPTGDAAPADEKKSKATVAKEIAKK